MGYEEDRIAFDRRREEYEVTNHDFLDDFKSIANEALDAAVKAARIAALAVMEEDNKRDELSGWEREGAAISGAPSNDLKGLVDAANRAISEAKRSQGAAELALTHAAYGTKERLDAGAGVGKHRTEYIGAILTKQFKALSALLKKAGQEAVAEKCAEKAAEKKIEADELAAERKIREAGEAAVIAAWEQRSREIMERYRLETATSKEYPAINGSPDVLKQRSNKENGTISHQTPSRTYLSAAELQEKFMKEYNKDVQSKWFSRRGLGINPSLQEILEHAKKTLNSNSRTFRICREMNLVDYKGEPAPFIQLALNDAASTDKNNEEGYNDGRDDYHSYKP